MVEWYKCPSCGNETFRIDKESLERGDKPTLVQCDECSHTLNV